MLHNVIISERNNLAAYELITEERLKNRNESNLSNKSRKILDRSVNVCKKKRIRAKPFSFTFNYKPVYEV